MKEPKLIKGDIFVDDRGEVSFVNHFDFKDIKRFYIIENHKQGFIRAWHAHKKEIKYFIVIKGAALICGVRIDNWDNPSKNLNVHRFVLSEKKPSILHLPEGYANGFMPLTENTKIIVFSTSTLEDSKKDDFRFHSHYWNPWTVEER